ncbi:hypothetical protein [Pseudoalteromonas byunsanensis]|uniref:Uncharacterized protein n=1 Tax=Pseudoalteromonas byunsanensis TaxID=327939 RepID=A0A1S1N8L4_9GAMM|nr:hypothetical protein [Pseudoalteromonas byunsanensis]OHU95693.1 hypothetical protein BIW53_07610 [Pseudoalteromonas byunsanensis]
MNKDLQLGNVILEWDGELTIFDDVELVEPDEREGLDELHMRVLLSTRRTDLQNMIDRFSKALGFAVGFQATENIYAKLVFAFCIVSVVNPYKVKILAGKGIDPLLEEAELDDETGEQKVKLDELLKYCKNAEVPSTFIDWLSENGFSYQTDTHVVFRNSFRRGSIISRA